MSKQRDRDEFIVLMAQEQVPVTVARQLLRAGATLQRIAELECDSEAADRDRVPCPGERRDILNGNREPVYPCLCQDYGSYQSFDDGTPNVHGTVPRIHVQEQCTQRKVRMLLAPHGIKPVFQGDPRGAVLKLVVPSGKTNDWGGTGICVP